MLKTTTAVINASQITGVLPVVNGGTGVTTSTGTGSTVLSTSPTLVTPILGVASATSLTLTSTDAGATAAPLLDLYRDSASPAASDTIGEIEFNGEDSAGNKQAYALFHGSILSPTSGAEQGQLHFETATGGALTEKMIIGTTNLVINEIGGIFNVRIEGDTDANLFFTDATNSRVGVGTISPASKLDVVGTVGISSTTTLSGLTASTALALNASKEIVSVTNTGTGNNVLATSPTLTTPNIGDATATSVTNAGTLSLAASGANIVEIKTNGTQRAQFTSGGYLKASDTGSYYNSLSAYNELVQSASNYIVQPLNTNATPYGINIGHTTDANNTGSSFLACSAGAVLGTLRAEIRSNGGIANYAANNVILSDRREKTNFSPATSYLDKICAITVQTFNYIDQNLGEDAGLTLGVVAQDVQAIAPELVTEGNWGTKEEPKLRLEIYQTDLQYALMKALQELKAEFDAYKLTHP